MQQTAALRTSAQERLRGAEHAAEAMTPSECISLVQDLLVGDLRLRSQLSPFRVELSPPPALPLHLPPAPSLDPPPLPLLITCARHDEPLGRPASSAGAAHGGRAFFQHPPPRVTLVCDRLRSAEDVRSALAHEAQHAVDATVAGMDLATCGGLACSEVRAAAMAECAHLPVSSRARRTCAATIARVSADMIFPRGAGSACVGAVLDLCLDTEGDVTMGAAYRHMATLV